MQYESQITKSKTIMSTPGYCSQIDHDKFKVRSQTDPNKFYIIMNSDKLVCSLSRPHNKDADCKHVKIVLDVMRRNDVYRNNTFRILKRSKLQLCKFCDSGNIIKKGTRKTKNSNTQIFKCTDCKRRFTANFGFKKKTV